MLAIQITRHGGPDVLRAVHLPDPAPGPGEVLIRNAWIGVNFVDLQHRAGTPYPVALPLVPGTEAAGEVVAVGEGVDASLTGTPVVHFGHLAGVYAELTAVPLASLVPLPPRARLDVAAAVALAGTTAEVLVTQARLGRDDLVAVQAAAGVTGGAIVQLAAAAGAEVVGIASSRERAEGTLALGARHAVAAIPGQDVPAAVRAATGGRGASVVFDGTGHDTFDTSLALLARFGTLVLYGQSSGPVTPFDPGRLSGITAAGGPGSLTLRWVSASHYLEAPGVRRSALQTVLGHVDDGRLSPRIVARLPLRDAAEAHYLLESRTTTRKVLLDAR